MNIRSSTIHISHLQSVFCLLACLCLLANSVIRASASTATYYLDSAGGNDANSGTSPSSAWKSLDKVNATTFHPGDSLLLKAGSVWRGQLWPKGSGSSQQPIHIGKYSEGSKPQIQGQGSVEDTLLLKNQEFWEIEDLDISNAAPDYKSIRRGVHIALDNFGDARHFVLRCLTVHDVSGRDDTKHNGGIILTSNGEKKPSRFIDVLIEGNELYHVDRNGISTWSDRWQRSLWYPSLRVIVRGNTLHDIGGDGIMIAVTDGALLEHNVVGRANQRSEGYNIAIWTWSADNSIIQFNEAFETKGQRDGEGFDSDWNSRNTLIQYNYSHDNDGGFLLVCDDGSQHSADSVGNIGTIVRYNISQNDRHRGIAISGPVRNTLVYNNTFFYGPDHPIDAVLFTDWSGWSASTSFLNNIFYAVAQARIGHAVSRADDGAHTSAPGLGYSRENHFDANTYFGQINSVEDPHASTADPRFTNPGQAAGGRDSLRGYSLTQDSPARKSGVPVTDNGGIDFFSAPLQNCAPPDRGAVQSSPCGAP